MSNLTTPNLSSRQRFSLPRVALNNAICRLSIKTSFLLNQVSSSTLSCSHFANSLPACTKPGTGSFPQRIGDNGDDIVPTVTLAGSFPTLVRSILGSVSTEISVFLSSLTRLLI